MKIFYLYLQVNSYCPKVFVFRGKQFKIYLSPSLKISTYFFQISILDDIANSLNFTYEVHLPSDGGLWGEVTKDGKATGLVGDIKVHSISYICSSTFGIERSWIYIFRCNYFWAC